MFPITVTISNQAQFNAVMALFQNADNEPVINTSPAINAKSKTAPKKETVKKDSSAPANLTTTEVPAILVANKQPTYTYEEAAKVLLEFSKTDGYGTVKAVLRQFGANNLPEIKPENYAAVIEAVMAAKG
ncbi:Putative uncharacterized protein [Mycoavidus cysteinexigens]|uniref:Uncharacterized protein n=2 Tax=Mycoavidus cysteinexigens TaxID=1553431 RepID=A0A2Z6EWI6_9BURK|nr:hypothetical protein [Mycoavidus cysteinexigens]BBE09809.1 Putative uncharacterized protein [Mycoavidus cysteinexigens]GAM53847.1 hypothetical protein EBME_2310 [bacterium endosymbiont of Mortierella elongata FMR23-6]GLR01710.1 hypothetical protein GCM10007934_15220 [Mycoavidus cysteinexigens]